MFVMCFCSGSPPSSSLLPRFICSIFIEFLRTLLPQQTPAASPSSPRSAVPSVACLGLTTGFQIVAVRARFRPGLFFWGASSTRGPQLCRMDAGRGPFHLFVSRDQSAALITGFAARQISTAVPARIRVHRVHGVQRRLLVDRRSLPDRRREHIRLHPRL